MTITEPDVPDNGRFPSGKAAKILGITRETLRQHTLNGYIKCVYHKSNARRLYMGSEIKRYWRRCF
jgi:predicted site-specific integrase-resolvase